MAFHADIQRGPALAELPALGVPELYALSARGRDIYQFRPGAGRVNLVMGLEGQGLDAHFPEDKRLSIPMREKAESLNAAAAAAMALAVLLPFFRN